MTPKAESLMFVHVLLTFAAGFILALSSEVALRGAAGGVLVGQCGLALAWLSLRRARWGFPITAGARTSLILVIVFLLGLMLATGFRNPVSGLLILLAMFSLPVLATLLLLRLALRWQIRNENPADGEDEDPSHRFPPKLLPKPARFSLKTLLLCISAAAILMGIARVTPWPKHALSDGKEILKVVGMFTVWSLALTPACLWAGPGTKRPLLGAILLVGYTVAVTVASWPVREWFYRNSLNDDDRLLMSFVNIGIIGVAYPTLLFARTQGFRIRSNWWRPRRAVQNAADPAPPITVRGG